MEVKEKKVRKNITLSKEVDEKLKELAKLNKKSQSELIEQLIKEASKELEKQKKLDALNRIKERSKRYAGLTENKSFQELKKEMGDEVNVNF